MKKITTLAFSLIIILGSAFAQKIDYDNSSKWFLGFNLGGTWQTTDVANRTSAGYGLTLGKSFNYNYGKRMTFDIRARYLGGNWYGQDYKKTDLSTYSGSILQHYKDSLGFAVNNFQTQVHRLGLELVLHANGVRERSGWDPYIFGGVGLTWYQTYGDLSFGDSTGANYYDYDEAQLGKTYVNSILDGQYETNLEGTSNDIDKWSVGFMPSLGFGIGYQVGKRVTLGIEHKTTFTLMDQFDGYTSTATPRNDIYHYTSLYVNFRFRNRHNGGTTGGGNLNNVNNNQNNLTNTGCISPVITYLTPVSNGTQSNALNYQVSAEIKDAVGRENITFKHNGVNNLNFTYNAQTDRFESNVILAAGMNTFEISATNACGSDVETSSISYVNCQLPVIAIVNPTSNNLTVSSPAFTLKALLQNLDGGQIAVSHNNVNSTNYIYNNANGTLQNDFILTTGINTFVITISNPCGTDVETVTVNYQTCLLPVISMVSPSSNGTTVNTASFNLSAQIQNALNAQTSLMHNNRSVTNFTMNNGTGMLQSTLTLLPGLNTFVVTSTNTCGTDTETITVNYQNCIAPIVTMVAPSVSGTTVSSANFLLKATIQHSNNGQGITLKHNNTTVTNFSFNNGTGALQSTITLLPGINTFIVSSVNSCGTDTETITVNYQNCIAPSISIVTPASNGTTVNSASFTLNAMIQNSNNGQGISLTLNNRSITNFSFNNGTGSFQSSVTLIPGLNTFVLTSTNACGTDTETITVNYQNCIAPSISIVTPASNGTTVNSAGFTLSAMIQNSNNGQGISLTLNNRSITNFTFNNGSGSFQSSVTLIPGLNTFVLTSTNACGTDTETITVNYQECIAPSIVITAPSANGTTVATAAFNFSAMITNSNNGQGITMKHNNLNISNFSFNNGTSTLQSALTLKPGLNTIVLTAINSCGTDNEVITINYTRELNNVVPAEDKITICHYPPGNTDNPQTIEIPLSAWPAHQAHGDKLGPCVETPPTNTGGTEEKITICHYPPGNTDNPQTIEIPLSAWPAHQAHGDKLGPCVETPPTNTGGTEEKITICHYPPGNNGNPQTIEIPLSAWPAHQAHGDKLGPCVETPPTNTGGTEEKITICHYPPGNTDNPLTIEIPLSAWPAHQAHGDKLGPCVVTPPTNSIGTDEKILICHTPPGNTGNPQTIEIPLSAWPAHEAHGDVLGACPEGGTVGNENSEEQKITICHIPPGNTGNPQTIEIPLSAWPAHQAHGDNLGPCPIVDTLNNNGNNNGNNGHGNNQDGVDSSNPGQGTGGPNGENDGNGDDENGTNGSNNEGNGNNGNGNGGNKSGNPTKTSTTEGNKTVKPIVKPTNTTKPEDKKETKPTEEITKPAGGGRGL